MLCFLANFLFKIDYSCILKDCWGGGGGRGGETRWKISPDFRSPEVGIPETWSTFQECRSHVISGVPQRTVLAPLLFLICINHIGLSLSSSPKLRQFADDTYSLRHGKCGIRGFYSRVVCVKNPERARYERVRVFDTNNKYTTPYKALSMS